LEAAGANGHDKVNGAPAFGVARETIKAAVIRVAKTGLVVLGLVDRAGAIVFGAILAKFEAVRRYAQRRADYVKWQKAKMLVFIQD
jgi:predicted LPLAT superfamily acyltransferase